MEIKKQVKVEKLEELGFSQIGSLLGPIFLGGENAYLHFYKGKDGEIILYNFENREILTVFKGSIEFLKYEDGSFTDNTVKDNHFEPVDFMPANA